MRLRAAAPIALAAAVAARTGSRQYLAYRRDMAEAWTASAPAHASSPPPRVT